MMGNQKAERKNTKKHNINETENKGPNQNPET